MISPALRKTIRRTWWLPLACFGLAFALNLTETVRRAEWRSLDWRTELRTHFQKGPDPQLTVVLFDDQTEALLDKPWPVDRQYHAQLTQVMALAGAKGIAWDVILDASREGDGDALLGEVAQLATENGTPVISAAVTNLDPTGAQPGQEGPTKPLPEVEGDITRVIGDEHAFIPFPQLRATSLYGFADTPPGIDGVRREVPLVLRVGKEVYPSLALQIVMSHFGLKVSEVRVKLGDGIYFSANGKNRRVPIDHAGRMVLNYRFDHTGHATDFPTYNYGSLLLALSTQFLENKIPTTPPPDLKDKWVIVGQVVVGKADIGPSPLSRLSPLSYVIANTVNNMLVEDYARRLSPWAIWPVAIFLGYISIALLAHRSVWILGSGTVVALAGYVAITVWLWIWLSWWVPLIAPFVGFLLLQFLVIGRRVWLEQKAKQEIKGMFGAYVSPEVVDRLVKSGEAPQLGGYVENITAYFSDIQGFSGFSEKLSPDRLVKLMNEYLTACTDIIQEEGGTLDKYIGDAVVAMFGAPIAQQDHAYRACVATQRVQRRLVELRAKWQSEGAMWPQVVHEMNTRIGLNSGPCVIGNMGSRTRFNYTMMGDDVNLAARMESGSKTWGAKTMCTEATKLACEQFGGDRVVFRPLGRIIVKGRAQPVPIFEIMGLREWILPAQRECIAVFTEALARYYARDWEMALALFRQSAILEAADGASVTINPSLIYADLTESYKLNPPPSDWDGVYVMHDK